MKTLDSFNAPRRALRQSLAPALLGVGFLLPNHSVGQAANSCNKLPNPDFELQNVSPLSGAADNVRSYYSTHDELTGWKSFNNPAGSAGKPTYLATNAPAGALSNPFTNNPTGGSASPFDYLGTPFTPYAYDASNPAVHNGAISILAVLNASSTGGSQVQYQQDLISPASLLTLSPGVYYSSFLAYRADGVGATTLGMKLTNPDSSVPSPNPTQSNPLQNAAWTRVSGKITVPAVSPTYTNQWNVIIGNLAGGNASSLVRVRYHIDEVELYKIPTAGPPASCSGGNGTVTIGEGCHIPNATYEWSRSSSPGIVLGTSITLSADLSDTYTLKVTLPDGSTYPSSVTVTGCASLPCPKPPTPEFTVTNPNSCLSHQVYFALTNRDPAYSYTITASDGAQAIPAVIAATAGATPGTTSSYPFRIKTGTPPVSYATFTVTATRTCNSTYSPSSASSSASGGADLNNCDTEPLARTYPNPSSESVAIPTGATEVVLLNAQGKAVAKPDKEGKLDVRDLPAGLYNLRMKQKGKLINQHIEVTH
ncbi:T9SS type A sorting domain-containing protein [Hymenobacter agri]